MLDFLFFWRKPFDRRTAKRRRRPRKSPFISQPMESASDPMTPFLSGLLYGLAGGWTAAALFTVWGVL